MAIFNIPYANHGNAPNQIEDLVLYLRLALMEAGHVVNISPHFDGQAFNILIELFSDETADIIVDASRNGVQFCVLGTENVTGNTFNDFRFEGTDRSLYSNRSEWDRRYKNFMRVAAVSRRVWCLTQVQVDGYATVIDRSRLSLLPIGYVDGFFSVEERQRQLKDLDFVFTGTLTDRRRRIVDALRQAGASVETFGYLTPAFIRSNAVARAKICLGMKQFDEWRFPSLIRNFYHLISRVTELFVMR